MRIPDTPSDRHHLDGPSASGRSPTEPQRTEPHAKLSLGASGPQVTELRTALGKQGLAVGEGDLFDRTLERAVAGFQRLSGLTPTGEADRQTLEALESQGADAPSSAATAPSMRPRIEPPGDWVTQPPADSFSKALDEIVAEGQVTTSGIRKLLSRLRSGTFTDADLARVERLRYAVRSEVSSREVPGMVRRTLEEHAAADDTWRLGPSVARMLLAIGRLGGPLRESAAADWERIAETGRFTPEAEALLRGEAESARGDVLSAPTPAPGALKALVARLIADGEVAQGELHDLLGFVNRHDLSAEDTRALDGLRNVRLTVPAGDRSRGLKLVLDFIREKHGPLTPSKPLGESHARLLVALGVIGGAPETETVGLWRDTFRRDSLSPAGGAVLEAALVEHDDLRPVTGAARLLYQWSGGIEGADLEFAALAEHLGVAEEVTVAVVDGPVDMDHALLADNLYTNPDEIAGDGVDNDGDGHIDDVHGWDFNSNAPA
ncbi:peptidoglycan-binding protein, partial [Planctomycetota bacterium]